MNGSATKKIQGRAAGQVQTSIAVDEKILKTLSKIAVRESRSRNRQIALFLERQVSEYERANGPILLNVAENNVHYGKQDGEK